MVMMRGPDWSKLDGRDRLSRPTLCGGWTPP